MNIFRFISFVSTLGLATPLVWWLLYEVLGRIYSDFRWWLFSIPCLDAALLLLWPASILLIGDSDGGNLALWAIAAIGNVLFYGVAGILVWLSIYRSKLFFLAAVFYVAAILFLVMGA